MLFTEQGVAMLSGVLNSQTAISVNISIIRVFTKLRKYAITHKEILLQLAVLRKDVHENKKDVENIFLVLKLIINPPPHKTGSVLNMMSSFLIPLKRPCGGLV